MNIGDWILYEDEDLLIINKPTGLMVHGDGRSKDKTLVDFILEKYPEIKNVGDNLIRPGIVHRLDKDTSGVLIIAKNQKTFLFIKKQFQERVIKKIYQTIVWNWVKDDQGIIDKPIGRSNKDFRQKSAYPTARGELREAITEYKVLKRFQRKNDKFSFLEVYPKTGRTHQIRVHLKYLNHPVVCDSLYASKKTCPIINIFRLALHAFSIEFQKPNGSVFKIEAPLPEDLAKALML